MRINQNLGGEIPPTQEVLERIKELTKPEKQLFEGIHLFIGIPTRDSRCYVDFAISLGMTMATIHKHGGNIAVKSNHNNCFVDVGRNHLVKEFMDGSCTHMLMVDDDMSWNPGSVEKMLMADKEFIAGVGPMKNPDEKDPKFAFNAENATEHPDGLWEVNCIGGAFCLFKRSVFEKMIKAYPETRSQWYDGGYHLFSAEVNASTLITEDYNFCIKWRKIGGKVWCFPDIEFGHLGSKVWKGNFYKTLKKTKKDMEVTCS